MRLLLCLFLLVHGFAFTQKKILFSPSGGNYPGLKKVSVQIPNGWSVYFTRDGTTPNKRSKKVNKEIYINGDEALYFAIYKGNKSPTYTSHTYITSRKQTLPIFSILTDPTHLFDSLNGIYEMGCCAESVLPFKGANFWKDIEKPIQIEFIDKNTKAFSQRAGIKIFGGYSVSMPQKSFAIYARKKYGDNRFHYPLFPQLPFDEYKNFVLRNSGGDMQGAHIRDAFATQLTKESGVAYQEYRPVVVYINGKYWGIYSLREKINEHFINTHFGIEKRNVSIIRPPDKVQEGPKSSLNEYQELIRFLQEKTQLTTDDITKVQQSLDIDDYLKYCIIQIYLGNSDASGNIRLYKDRVKKTPYKTVLFDLDMTLNIFDENKHKENSLALFTSTVDTNIQYPTEYTLLLRKLLTNDSIKKQFIHYFIDAINTYFKPKKAHQLLAQLTNHWSSEMVYHQKRWNVTELRYNRSMNRLKTFIQQRPSIMRKHLKDFFDLNETFDLQVNVSKGGKIQLNSLHLTANYSAPYFKDVPIQYKAIPDENYEFVGWKNQKTTENKQYITVNAEKYSITPVFKLKNTPPYFNRIILSELNITQPKAVKHDDWIEIYNASDDTIDLSNWVLKDNNDKNGFKLKEGTFILPNNHLIFTKNTEEFKKQYGNELHTVGDVPFGFNSQRDNIRLYDKAGFLVIHLDLSKLPKLENKNNSWSRTSIHSADMIDKQWSEAKPSPGTVSFITLLKKEKDKLVANTLIFFGIIAGLLVIILFFIILAVYIGKD